MIKLSILIPTTPDREVFLDKLLTDLGTQCDGIRFKIGHISSILIYQMNNDVEVIVYNDNKIVSIGDKRTILLRISKGEYVSCIDSDDEISRDYVSKIMKATETNPDCCSLLGVYTVDGTDPVLFEHSIKYKEWKTNHPNNPIRYERSPNHLNAIKREIAVKYDFIPVNNGEDRDWSVRIMPELKTESYVDGVIYHYKYRTNK